MFFTFGSITHIVFVFFNSLYIYIYIMYLFTCINFCRYGREGRLSYYRLDRLIPPEISLTKSDMNFLSRAMDITHRGMRKVIGQMAKFLGVTKIICPDLYSLVNRYCIELALPSMNRMNLKIFIVRTYTSTFYYNIYRRYIIVC